MSHKKTARQVFDAWAQDHHAEGMERHHGPRVRQALERVKPFRGDYLEVGVGNGYGLHHVASTGLASGRCVGVDLSPHMIERTREKVAGLDSIELHRADFMDWTPDPPERRFALIFSMEVFYYFADIGKAIERAASLLKPGGTLMVLVNYYAEHEASHAWPAQLDTPMQLWSADDYVAGFRAAGLRDVGQARLTDETPSPGDPGTLATWGRAVDG